MSWLKRVIRAMKPEPGMTVEAPSAEYPRPLDAMAAILEHYLGADTDESWVTFEAQGTERSATVQVAGRVINLLLEGHVDLPGILRRNGLDALAGGCTPSDDMWILKDAGASELAMAVHTVFVDHHALGEGYRLRGFIES